MIKYSVLMPYYNRAAQLEKTFSRFLYLYRGREDWEVVLVEDRKNATDLNKHLELVELICKFRRGGGKLTHLIGRGLTSPGPHYNQAASHASGSFLVLTSPEVLHLSNVFEGLDYEFGRNHAVYVVCACKSVGGRFKGGWLQHGKHRPAGYHFCTAISRGLYLEIGGFDERFGNGYCFDDDDWRETVRAAEIPFVVRDDLITEHLDHPKEYPPDRMKLWRRNLNLYEQKWGLYEPC